MRLSTIVLTSAVVVLASAAFALQRGQQAPTVEGKAAPAFSAKGTDGKSYSLNNVTKAPMVMVFWKNPCPHNPRASKLVNSIVDAYKGKVNIVGVVNAEGADAKAFQKEFGPNYPFLQDGDKSIIKDYKMSKSIQFVVIGKDKKVETVIGGYSQASMKKLNAAMAKAAGMKEASLDFSAAPTKTTYG